MFGTLLGPLPWPVAGSGSIERDTADDAVPRMAPAELDAAVQLVIQAQIDAGLEPLTDGGLRHQDPFEVATPGDAGAWAVDDWRFSAAFTDRVVKQMLPGPYTVGGRYAERHAGADREDVTQAAARALHARILELIEAGCTYVEIHEPDATQIGADDAERRRFAGAQAMLLDGIAGTHVSLAITGGAADAAGPSTILASGYQSLAVDLIAGPDNWRLVAAAPGTWGIVCGALSAAAGSDDGPELLVWATRYAASTGGRGAVRVGLATASGLDGLAWHDAVRKMERLGAGARLAGLPPGEELASALDPRSIDLRSRALGRRRPRGPLRPTEPPRKET